MKKLISVLGAALVAVAVARPAAASPAFINFQGAAQGHSVSGTVGYDTTAQMIAKGSDANSAFATYGFAATAMLVDGVNYSIGGIMGVVDAPSGSGGADSFSTFANFSGSGRDSYSLDIAGADSMLSSTAVPSFELAGGAGSFSWVCRDCNTSGVVQFTIPVSFQVLAGSVPEPATWLAMIFGVAASGMALRRRRSGVAAVAGRTASRTVVA